MAQLHVDTTCCPIIENSRDALITSIYDKISPMLRVEFHCHTIYSKDSLLRPEDLVKVCQQKQIDRVVVTDHNTTAGAFACQVFDPQRVIIGEEIMTTQGELLGFFLQEEIPAGLTPEETIRRLRDQGAFISVSHPFDRYRGGSWQSEDLKRILDSIDAIEIFNARCYSSAFNKQAQDFASFYALSGTTGSDAHAGFELGMATLLLPEFTNTASLKDALIHASPDLHLSSPLVHFVSRYAVFYKKLFGGINSISRGS